MFNRNHVCAIAAVAAFSMLSLTACSDENLDITNVPEESELSSSSTPSVEPESSSSSERELSSSSVHSIVPKSSSSETEQSSSSAPSIESSSSSEKSSSSSEKSPDSDLIEADVKCNAIKPNPVDGDECSYKNDGGYLSEFVYVDGRWRKLSDVSTSDQCSTNAINSRLYKKLGEDYYYCAWGEWFLAVMVPQQFTDPRKEGLSDEEYDVLDLPKNASVGDRAEGALERCVNGASLIVRERFDYGVVRVETQASAYCVAENHYRYRSNGTWTLETDEDLQNDRRFQEIECTEGNLGAEYELGDGKIYRCENVSVTDFCNKNTCKYSWKPGAVVVDVRYKRSTLASPTEACNESNDGEKVTIDAGPIVSGDLPCYKRLLDYQCKYDSENSSGKWEVVGAKNVSFYD